MKKTIAFLMALLMILNCCIAFAETAFQYLNFTADEFKTTFDTLAEENDMQYSWGEEALYTYGYPMYYAMNDKGNIYVVIHDKDGIIGIETDILLTPADMNDSEFSTEMGRFIGAAVMTAYVLQHPEAATNDITAATGSISKLLVNLANLSIEDSPTSYEEDLCEDMKMHLAWKLDEQECMIYFTVIGK